MEAIEIFKEVIGKRLLPLVVSFNPYTKKYQIHPFRHAITPTFEKDFSDILFDSIIFYAFEKNEIEREYDRGKLSDLRRASRAAYESRVPKTEKQVDGLLGELALDNFIKMFFEDIELLYSRVKYLERRPQKELTEKRTGQEVKGYDGLVFSSSNGQRYMWVGQVKTGDWTYCLRGIKEDINKSILETYFSSAMLIMTDIMRSTSSNSALLQKIIDDLNDLQLDYSTDLPTLHKKVVKYFKDNRIIIRLPCLIIVDEKNYDDESQLLETIKKKCSNAFDSFIITNNSEFEIEVLFMVFPVRNLAKIREEFLNIRKNI